MNLDPSSCLTVTVTGCSSTLASSIDGAYSLYNGPCHGRALNTPAYLRPPQLDADGQPVIDPVDSNPYPYATGNVKLAANGVPLYLYKAQSNEATWTVGEKCGVDPEYQNDFYVLPVWAYFASSMDEGSGLYPFPSSSDSWDCFDFFESGYVGGNWMVKYLFRIGQTTSVECAEYEAPSDGEIMLCNEGTYTAFGDAIPGYGAGEGARGDGERARLTS